MSTRYFILGGKDNHEVIPSDLKSWAQWFETNERFVQLDTIGEVRVSTVFLGLDHSFNAGPPLLFETMIFEGAHDLYQERYSTWDEAVEGHRRALNLVKQ